MKSKTLNPTSIQYFQTQTNWDRYIKKSYQPEPTPTYKSTFVPKPTFTVKPVPTIPLPPIVPEPVVPEIDEERDPEPDSKINITPILFQIYSNPLTKIDPVFLYDVKPKNQYVIAMPDMTSSSKIDPFFMYEKQNAYNDEELKMPDMSSSLKIDPAVIYEVNNNFDKEEIKIPDMTITSENQDIKSQILESVITIIIFNEECMIYLSKELKKDLLKYNIKSFIVFTTQIEEYIDLIQKPNIYFLFTCMFKINIILPKNKYIVYQLEQNINNGISPHYTNYDYMTVFNNALYVVDYSRVNMKVLENLDIKSQYLPIPYHIGNRHIGLGHIEKKYDILFIGCINERRQKILKAMSNRYNVYIPKKPIYGLDLMNLMNQCKILVNIHFYENALLEIPRINEALNSNIRIISEKDIVQGPDITNLYGGLVTFIENIETDYTELFGAVEALLKDDYVIEKDHIERLCKVEDNYNECFGKWVDDFISTSNMANKIKYKEIAIITANIGGYDQKIMDISQMINKDFFDWYYFTDSFITSTDWNIIDDKTINKNIKNMFGNKNMMTAKYYKVQPYDIEILQKYKYIIWIDGSIELRNHHFVQDIIQKIESSYLQKNIYLFEHYIRENIWDEYILSCSIPKYSDCDMLNQVEKYMSDMSNINDKNKYPKLYECGIIIYRACPSIYNLCHDWWEEINKYGFQDQLSFPYVLYKNNIIPELLNEENFIKGSLTLEGSVWNNKRFGYVRNHA